MVRPQLNRYKPVFKGAVENWSRKYCRQNLWRVTPAYEFEDLFQEAHLKFLQCADRYIVVEPRHFMSIYKTALTRRFTDLANERVPQVDYDCQEIIGNVAGLATDELVIMWYSCPKEVQALLCKLFDCNEKRLKERRRPYKLAKRETNNDYFCRLLGLDPLQINLAKMLQSALVTS